MGGGDQFRLADSVYPVGRRDAKLLYQPYIASVRRAMMEVGRTVPDYAYGVSSERLEPRRMRFPAWATRPIRRLRAYIRH